MDHAVRTAVLAKLIEHYRPHALDNYRALVAQFDSAATKFTAAANVIDPEVSATAMVNAPDKVRKGWTDAERYAHQLTAALPALQAAARLAGRNTTAPEYLLPLCVDAAGLHRRRVWEAWDTDTDTDTDTGRTGRWGALAALGATIRAADLDHLEPYRQPRPMEVKQVRVGLGVRQVSVDPEDVPAEVAAG